MGSWFETTSRFADPAGALRMAHFVGALRRFPTGHVVDLGAGHGIFARLAADLGWRVTAVDARTDRFPADPRVRWVRADVREFDDYAGVDVVACLGLWYHLTLADQLGLVRRVAPVPLILDTHVALRRRRDHPVHARRVGRIVAERGYRGRLYAETGVNRRPTASWGNTSSFWPTMATLRRQLLEGGYDVVERIAPAVAPDREYLVARALDAAGRAELDQLLSRYNAQSGVVPAAGVPAAGVPAAGVPTPSVPADPAVGPGDGGVKT